MGLLADIQREATDADSWVSALLRRCQILEDAVTRISPLPAARIAGRALPKDARDMQTTYSRLLLLAAKRDLKD
jgi:hypothetical protein